MKPFDLKKYLAENKATFHSALNESYDEQEAHKVFDYHEKTGQLPPGMSEEEFEELMDKYNIKRDDMSDIPFYNMKESKLRSKIREMILAEMELDVQDSSKEDSLYDPVYENSFLSELESMLDEEGDIYEAKKDEEEAPEETPAPEEEEVDTTVDVETDEVNPAVKAVQDALTQAQAAAQKLGDEKLLNQIGNTITFFTREHVVEKPGKGELQESFIRKMQLRAGIIK